MKKIICFLLVCVIWISACFFPVLATEENEPLIMQELQGVYIDGKQFSEEDYPLDGSDSNFYMITAVERGFNSVTSSPSHVLFLYVYNPSGKTVTDSEWNSVQLGLSAENDDTGVLYDYYGLKLMSITEDNRFLKFKVTNSSMYASANDLYKKQTNETYRVYNVVSFRLQEDGRLDTYDVSRCFTFEGFGDNVTCKSMDLDTLDIELHFTNWVSPNAGTLGTNSVYNAAYNHYEINTAYFSVPSEYVTGGVYDKIVSIRAIFEALKTTPIIISEAGKLTDETIEAIKSASVVEPGGDIDVTTLAAVKGFGYGATLLDFLVDSVFESNVEWFYTDSSYISQRVSGRSLEQLAYYFEVAELPDAEDFKENEYGIMLVSAEELEAYFYERWNDSSYDKTALYTETKTVTMDYSDELYDMQTFSSAFGIEEKSLLGWQLPDYLFADFNVECKMFNVIEDPSIYSSISDPQTVVNELFLGRNDVGAFSEFCKEAASKGEAVVLLRFGFSEYTCMPIYDFDWAGNRWIWEECAGYSVEKWVYRNVNVASITFSKDTELITVPVVSNTGDSFGDVVVFEPPASSLSLNLFDYKEQLSVLKFILGFVLIVIAIFLLVLLFDRVREKISDRKTRRALKKTQKSQSDQKKRRK